MTLGIAYDFSADMGSLISEGQLKTVSDHVEDAKAKGAKVIAGGKARPDIGPLFYEPTVMTGVTPEMECAANETFGPLVSIYPVADIEEAIARANDTEYGLNASVWATADGEKIATRLRSGTVNVNEGYAFAWGSLSAPMGGMGLSGMGRRHGPEGLLKYTEAQTIATARVLNLDPPFGIPPTLWQKSLLPMVQAVMRLPGRT
jgi:succinate-semialdehyde dehydrogenase/glutarate-semialdehyde dehydrogenase